MNAKKTLETLNRKYKRAMKELHEESRNDQFIILPAYNVGGDNSLWYAVRNHNIAQQDKVEQLKIYTSTLYHEICYIKGLNRFKKFFMK